MTSIPIKAKINLETGEMQLEYAEVEEAALADFFLDGFKRSHPEYQE